MDWKVGRTYNWACPRHPAFQHHTTMEAVYGGHTSAVFKCVLGCIWWPSDIEFFAEKGRIILQEVKDGEEPKGVPGTWRPKPAETKASEPEEAEPEQQALFGE